MPISVCTSARNPGACTLKEHTNIDRFFQLISPYVPVFVEENRGRLERPRYCFHLADLWKFYDRPYGLPVSLKGDRDARVSVSFVPYLSAVQVFGAYDRVRHIAGGHVPNRARVVESLLVAASASGAGQRVAKVGGVESEVGTSGEQEPLVLLFQFFERHPPEKRPPAFQKILELTGLREGHVLWDAFSTDVHPDSWFCINWVPVLSSSLVLPFRGSIFTYHHFRLREKNFYLAHPLFEGQDDRLRKMGSRLFEEHLSSFSSLPAVVPREWEVSGFCLSHRANGVGDDTAVRIGGLRCETRPRDRTFSGFVPLFGYFSYNIRKDAWFLPDPEAAGKYFHPRYHFAAAFKLVRWLYETHGLRHPDYEYCAQKMCYPRVS